MATTIEEVQRIDEIKCINTGAVEVLKGNYYIKTVTEMMPVVDEEGNDTGETEEQVTVTEDRISNWRVSITAHDTALADSVLEESSDVAKAHWTKFPVPEPELSVSTSTVSSSTDSPTGSPTSSTSIQFDR